MEVVPVPGQVRGCIPVDMLGQVRGCTQAQVLVQVQGCIPAQAGGTRVVLVPVHAVQADLYSELSCNPLLKRPVTVLPVQLLPGKLFVFSFSSSSVYLCVDYRMQQAGMLDICLT